MGNLSQIFLHAGPSVLAAFLASLVEFVEALTVILAVGSVRGWRDAIGGAAAAIMVLLIIIVVLGSASTHIQLKFIQLAIGVLLLLFGMRWLRKSILRSAGGIPKHDEETAFVRQTEAMRQHGPHAGWDGVAFGASFQITMLEGTEVVFIVIAIGAGGTGLLLPAGLGALAALFLVVLLGLAIHKPLTSVPENALKFFVGVLLSAFGSFWIGEGMGISWLGADWSILGLISGFLIVAWLAVLLCRNPSIRLLPSTGK